MPKSEAFAWTPPWKTPRAAADPRVRGAIIVQRMDMESLQVVAAYLPSNYAAVGLAGEIMVIGRDLAGWTLDDYVIPRLASGLITAREVYEVNVPEYVPVKAGKPLPSSATGIQYHGGDECRVALGMRGVDAVALADGLAIWHRPGHCDYHFDLDPADPERKECETSWDRWVTKEDVFAMIAAEVAQTPDPGDE